MLVEIENRSIELNVRQSEANHSSTQHERWFLSDGLQVIHLRFHWYFMFIFTNDLQKALDIQLRGTNLWILARPSPKLEHWWGRNIGQGWLPWGRTECHMSGLISGTELGMHLERMRNDTIITNLLTPQHKPSRWQIRWTSKGIFVKWLYQKLLHLTIDVTNHGCEWIKIHHLRPSWQFYEQFCLRWCYRWCFTNLHRYDNIDPNVNNLLLSNLYLSVEEMLIKKVLIKSAISVSIHLFGEKIK